MIDADTVSPEENNAAKNFAHELLNQFLDVYRFVRRDPEVRPLTVAEFHQFRGGRGLLVKSNLRHPDGRGQLTSVLAFHEPRFRPHPIQRQMVEAGALGRKTKRGFYSYD